MGLSTEFLAYRYSAITASDTDEHNFKALYVGSAGDLVVERFDGPTATFASVPAGSLLPIAGKRVRTGTTAGSIVAIY